VRALVVAPQPFFSPRGTPFSVYYRTLITTQLGVDVDLLTYGEGQDVEIPGLRIHRIPRFGFLGPVAVGPSLLKLWLDGFLVLWTLGLLLRRRYDFVHAHEESVFFLRFLKPIFRFKLVYDMHSSLPQQLSNFKFTESRALIRLFELLEDSCLRRADAVITICPELRDYALPRVSDPRRHFLIENSLFDEVRLARVAGNGAGLPRDPDLPLDRPIVAYAGTFESYQGIDLLIEAFARTRTARPEAFLLLIGGSAEQVASARALADRLGIPGDVCCTGRLDPAAVKRQLRRAAVLTSPRTAGTNTPLKIYEQLASGIPLVATRILSHTQVLDDRVCFLADPDPDSLSRALLAALEGGPACARVVQNAQELYRRDYSREAYLAKMSALLEVLH